MGRSKYTFANSSAGRAPAARQAFTLVEVLVAMTIFAVGIVATVSGFSQSLKAGSAAGKLDRASALAQRELTKAITDYSGSGQAGAGTYEQFTWRLSVADRQQGLVMASIEVKWRQQGAERTFILSQVFIPPEQQRQP